MLLPDEIKALLDKESTTQVFVGVADKDGNIEFAYAMNVANVALLLALASDAVVNQSKAMRK